MALVFFLFLLEGVTSFSSSYCSSFLTAYFFSLALLRVLGSLNLASVTSRQTFFSPVFSSSTAGVSATGLGSLFLFIFRGSLNLASVTSRQTFFSPVFYSSTAGVSATGLGSLFLFKVRGSLNLASVTSLQAFFSPTLDSSLASVFYSS